MSSFEESLFKVELRLAPNHAIQNLAALHLRRQPVPLIGYQLHPHHDGLRYWIFWNPAIPEVAETDETFREVHGLILLVSGPDWPDKMHSFNTDLLMGVLPHNIILPFEEKWKHVRHMLKRLELERNGRRFPRFLFAIVLPENVRIANNRKRITFAHDFAMAGTTFLAAQLECRLSRQHGSDEVALRPHEFVFIEYSSTQIRLTFGEEFIDLRDRILATWICKQMSRRGNAENQLTRPRWWMTYSFEPPPKGKKMKQIKGIFVTWTVERPNGNEQDFNILLCLIAVSFRPFLKRSVSQLRWYQNRDIANRVDTLYRI
eukprot:Gregarina_sp_Pseudo_9__1147@NODE_1755_length_1351_cov_6_778201_g1628_i0_p1_GENE_NODE_1755_length_1351_cov_6_778201_g1628_i0NODE_1755_length_1351_cov_6_778201_g1628_i0_p1_ORF_typecomplete_len337_score4_73P34Arc/PF04045_14/0_002_NODE_1755_length_1351_cov_6_778201_g1628_i03391289